MNRREFVVASSSAIATCVIALRAVDSTKQAMRHSYCTGDGEVIAANTLEQAARYHDCELGGADEPDLDDWHQCPDRAFHTITDDDGSQITKTFAEWAAEHDEPGYVSSTYC